MDYIVLIIVALVFLITAFYGYKKGFVNIVLTLVASVAAMLLTFVLMQPVTKLIKDNTDWDTKLEEQMNGYISEYIDEYIPNDIDSVKVTDEMLEQIEEIPIPESIKNMLLEDNIQEKIDDSGADDIGEYLSKELAALILNVIVYVCILVIITIIFGIIIKACNIITRLPVIKEVNNILGLVIGLAEGLIIVWVLALFVTALAGTEMGQEILRQISDNNVLSFIYKNNPLMKIFSGIF